MSTVTAVRKRRKALHLAEYDRIVAVVPERCHGPGWANSPLWVYVRDGNGEIRAECLQPNEQTGDILLLFGTVEAAHSAMRAAVERAVRP